MLRTRLPYTEIDRLDGFALRKHLSRTLERVNLPDGLHHLAFGFRFNQGLEHVTLPNRLQSLTFGHNFNQDLGHVRLPPALKTLTFGHDFAQPLTNVHLPSSLESLIFGHEFNHSLEAVTGRPTTEQGRFRTVAFERLWVERLDDSEGLTSVFAMWEPLTLLFFVQLRHSWRPPKAGFDPSKGCVEVFQQSGHLRLVFIFVRLCKWFNKLVWQQSSHFDSW